MKAPICEVCLASKILCKSCKERLNEGEISKSEVYISRLLHQISSEAKSLKGIHIKKIIDTPGLVLIISKKGDAARIVGKSGIIVKKLSKTLGKKIKVIEESSDPKTFFQNLIFPVPLLGINILYAERGEILKIKVPRDRALPISKSTFKETTKLVLKKDIEIVEE